MVIVNPLQLVAIAAVPREEGLSHYRFLYRGAVPDVVVARDIGAPPRCIEAIYDRILTTLLERLDPNRQELSQRLIIFIATTNTPHLVDSALFRRIGGSIDHFGRLGRRSFSAVLGKHVCGLPAASRNGCSQAAIWRRNVDSTPELVPVSSGPYMESLPVADPLLDYLDGAF